MAVDIDLKTALGKVGRGRHLNGVHGTIDQHRGKTVIPELVSRTVERTVVHRVKRGDQIRQAKLLGQLGKFDASVTSPVSSKNV